MLPRGIPETIDEASAIVSTLAELDHNTSVPSHYPHSQLIALARVVDDLRVRVEGLEAKPRRGRPPKDREYEPAEV